MKKARGIECPYCGSTSGRELVWGNLYECLRCHGRFSVGPFKSVRILALGRGQSSIRRSI